MSLKKKEVRVCDFCNKEVPKEFVKIDDVANEGYSVLSSTRKYYNLKDLDFCDLECFFNDVKKKLCE